MEMASSQVFDSHWTFYETKYATAKKSTNDVQTQFVVYILT